MFSLSLLTKKNRNSTLYNIQDICLKKKKKKNSCKIGHPDTRTFSDKLALRLIIMSRISYRLVEPRSRLSAVNSSVRRY